MATPSSCHVESSILRFENSPESQHLSGLVLAILFLASLLLSQDPWKIRGLLLLTVLMPFLITDNRTLFPYLPLFGLGFLRFLSQARKLSAFEIAIWCVPIRCSATARECLVS
jgi:hypothetical protein